MGRASVVAGLVWLAGTVAATAVSLSAVRIVGEEVGGSASAPLSGPAVRRALAELPATSPRVGPVSPPNRPATPPRAATPDPFQGTTVPGPSPSQPVVTAPAPMSRTYALRGGMATVGCAGGTVSLSFASPTDGYDQKVDSAGPAEVILTWESRSSESRLRVTCAGGVPQARVEEHGSGSGHGSGRG